MGFVLVSFTDCMLLLCFFLKHDWVARVLTFCLPRRSPPHPPNREIRKEKKKKGVTEAHLFLNNQKVRLCKQNATRVVLYVRGSLFGLYPFTDDRQYSCLHLGCALHFG